MCFESVIPDSSSPAVPAISDEDVEALVRLGLGRKQARTRIQRAVDSLDDGKVLSRALSSG